MRPSKTHLTVDALLAGLLDAGQISRKDHDDTLTVARMRGRTDLHPLALVGERRLTRACPPGGTLDVEALTEWLAGEAALPYFHIDPLKIDVTSVCNVVSHAYATRFRILPVAVHADEVTVATAEPYESEWQGVLEQALQIRIKRVLANPTDIVRYLAEFYSLARSLKQAVAQHEGMQTGIGNFEQLVKLGSNKSLDANDQAVIHIVDWLLQYAFDQRASDIHIEPRREVCNVRFRIDGVMHLVYQTPVPVMAAITNRIKLMGRMDVVEKRRPQDGRIKTQAANGEEIELRLSTMPTAFGEKLVLRIFNPDVLLKSFADLGFARDEEGRWRRLFGQPNGIILVTGPTGSGKTTTLYSTLKELARPEVNVCTVEDPIEMVYPHLNQMQVQHNIGLDFASGVRTLLRQDPDVIMVGEIRDLETAEMAIQAALTGHLVLSTLHTNDAPSALTRLMDLGVPPYLIRSTLLGVLAQRLVRTLCPHCKQPAAIDAGDWKDLLAPWSASLPHHAQKPQGCLECRMTGYHGRIGLYEMMVMSPSLREEVSADMDAAHFRAQAIKEGMQPLRLAGARHIAAGTTTLEEVARSTPPASGEPGA
ncbi:Flp pilus assembly complex ATPase component [Nitrogeniibacter mangrovi]|uniref:Flp pilus assembly complex ATPase component n=1 Tax=Nitrogeniibacter mangrovi TaxID=2016596 RepID=A0A6C1B2X2_9RHOO|nr:GspE/PulE family protein [Nitrogeniibacter mangrovi]QID18001.1 Flp pilus assembly complex ATPase component [Nitrogeniibacter mangrovi]